MHLRDGAFTSIDELSVRVPELNRKELIALANIGALNSLDNVKHRRDALWQVEQAARPSGLLLRSAAALSTTSAARSPLITMSTDERLIADYSGTGLTTGPHPMAYYRAALRNSGVMSVADLASARNQTAVCIAGSAPAPPKDLSSSHLKMKPELPTSSSLLTSSSESASRSRASTSSGSMALFKIRMALSM